MSLSKPLSSTWTQLCSFFIAVQVAIISIHSSSRTADQRNFYAGKLQHTTKVDSAYRQRDVSGKLEITYLAVVDTAYLEAASDFVSTLRHFNVETTEISVGCLSNACTAWCAEKGVRSTYFPRPESGSHVQLSKTQLILDELSSNRSVFFFDLDVTLYQHPQNMLRQPGVGAHHVLLVQTDGGTNVNYGHFFARPTVSMVQLFTYIQDKHQSDGTWDQQLFNEYLMLHSTHEMFVLPQDKYVNMMLGFENTSDIFSAHATCIEGPKAKLFATHYFFGVQFEVELQTVLLNIILERIRSELAMLNALRLVAFIAKHTGRYVRFRDAAGCSAKLRHRTIYDPANMYRIVSMDSLAAYGVSIVDPRYRECTQNSHVYREIHGNGSKEFMVALEPYLSNAKHENIDELVLNVNTPATNSVDPFVDILTLLVERFGGDEIFNFNFLCSLRNRSGSCLHVCDGKHYMY